MANKTQSTTEPFGSTSPEAAAAPSYANYGQKATSDIPIFFLGRKDQSARMRIGTPPFNYNVRIKDSDVERFAWGVILKEVNDKGEKSKRAVVFTASAIVYDQIRDLVQNPKFGDPSNFDIIVTRTENPNQYYSVRIIESTVRPMSDDDKAVLADGKLDVQKIVSQAESVNPVTNVAAPVNDPLAAADFD